MSDEPDERPPPEKVLTAEELIRRHQLGIWRYLRMLGCDDSLADDLTQETLVKVICQESFSQWSQSATAAYLRRTARNLLITHHRKGGRVKTIVTDDPLDEIWDRWAGSDLSGDEGIDCLRICLDSITDRARLALQMRFAENASRASIAEKLGISEHGARNLMQRAKQQLRDCVQSKLTELKNKRDPGERNRWPEAETER